MHFINQKNISKLTATGLLISIGILIPLFMPIRFIFGDGASYTLAVHVPILLAMFISPSVAILTSIGSSFGFFLSGVFPPIVVVRASSHIVFVIIGSYYLKKIDKNNMGAVHTRVFSIIIAIIHAIFEVLSVFAFHFFIGNPINNEVIRFVLIFIGIGTFFHSILDFEIANAILLSIKKHPFYLKISK